MGGVSGLIQVLGVLVVVMWSHILEGYMGGGSGGVGLDWGDGTFGALHFHILAWRFPVCLPCSPSSV